ncbi:MAG: hypothetical protein KF819_33785 [Labilithrix sp.]|nr:hypothetical protein [Labilithrix sp.]
MSPKSVRTSRKLLVAAIGVATLNYVVACENKPPPTSGNLPAPRPPDAAEVPPTSGNLPAPVIVDAGASKD